MALDGLAPVRSRHDGLTVTAEMGKLVVHADEPEFGSLDRARAAAARAVNDLPETPFTAAGFNVRYKIDDPSDDLLAATESGIDALLSDSGFAIQEKVLHRTVTWGEGAVKLTLHSQPETKVEMNFHKRSAVQKELSDWLSTPIEDVKETVGKLLSEVIGIEPEGTD